ncbi:Spon1 [Symbiodinium natans]|uniref:Spon1 protein n=1 Tax=Symbiodinium natans TaxID=878477 RepID=A0A812N7P3_9DINO|nr:Spon1 [Symbiodinium natans]
MLYWLTTCRRLGAVEYFAPYFQVGLLKRLARVTRPGGLLILLGREPEELQVDDETSQLAVDIQCFRDSVILLGRKRPYREMPRRWVAEQLWQQGLQLEGGRRFPRRLDLEKVERNLAWAEEELERVPDLELRNQLSRHLDRLRARVAASASLRKGHTFGEDYGLILRKPKG